MFVFLLILLLFSIVSEGTITTLPLVLVSLLCLTIFTRNSMVFLTAFLSGILLDAFALRPLGWTSLFLLTFVFLILLYQRKYEIYSYQFVVVASFLGGLLFLFAFQYSQPLVYAFVGSVVAVCFFALIRLFHVTEIQD